MAPDLFEHDIATFSEQQSELLRRLARGERVNDVDWENVAEEIGGIIIEDGAGSRVGAGALARPPGE